MDYPVLKKNFENHRFHTSYFETKEEAAAYLAEQIKGEPPKPKVRPLASVAV